MTQIAFHALWGIPALMLLLAALGAIQLKGDAITTIPGQPGQSILIQMAENKAGEVVATLGIAGIVSIVAFLRPVWTNRALYLWALGWNLLLLAISLAIP